MITARISGAVKWKWVLDEADTVLDENQVWARVAVLNENRHTKTDTSLATTTV